MSCVIAFPLPRHAAEAACAANVTQNVTQGETRDVPRLANRLLRMERSQSPDEAVMEQLVDAELATLAALARAPARDVAEVAIKLTALVRRIEAGDEECLPEGELALLRGALRDLRRLGRNRLAAQA